MKKLKLILVILLLLKSPFSYTINKENDLIESDDNTTNIILNGYNSPNINIYKAALCGFNKYKFTKHIITIIDFTLPSTEKRLWVINTDNNSVVYNTYVSHGRNSGLKFATSFSNKLNSNMSSLGFYMTSEIYNGKHGKSLKIDGLERGLNDNARKRNIVIHGAEYSNYNFIKMNGYLGRSQGCPALPTNISSEIINYIKEGSCLYIYYN